MPAESDGIDDAVEGGQSGTSWKRIYYTMEWQFNVTKSWEFWHEKICWLCRSKFCKK